MAFPGSPLKHASILFIKKNQKIFGTESPKQAFDLHLEQLYKDQGCFPWSVSSRWYVMYPTSEKPHIEDLEVNIEDLDVNTVDKDPDFVLPPVLTDPSTKEDMDRLLDNSTEDVSPIKFQIQSPVNDISDALLWYHKRKYKEVKAAFKEKFCSLVAPGQAEEFESLVSSESDSEDSDKSDRITAELQALVDAYDSTDNERHKLMILSVLPPEHYSKQKIMKLFNCSRYKADA